jgi:hypothetical protein
MVKCYKRICFFFIFTILLHPQTVNGKLNDAKFLRMLEAMYGDDQTIVSKVDEYDECANKGLLESLFFTGVLSLTICKMEATNVIGWLRSTSVALKRTLN